MQLTAGLKGARLTVTKAAELAGISPTHFHRLVKQGTFPAPKRTARGRPYYDYDLLSEIAQIKKSGIGRNGGEVVFYSRGSKRAKAARPVPSVSQVTDPYLKKLAAGLKQLGIPKHDLGTDKLNTALTAEFGQDRPDLAIVIPAIARRFLS